MKIIYKLLLFFVFGIFGGIFADQILWPYFIERPLLQQYHIQQNPVYVTERKEVFIEENIALKEAIEKVSLAIVAVQSKTKEGVILEGSGITITNDGLMVTLAELVPQGANISFFAGEKPLSYQILKRDQKNNLALVKLTANNLAAAEFADFDKLKLGERVFLVSFSPSLKSNLKNIVNEGIIRNFNEDLITTNIFEEKTLKGSSLFNIKGELLGLNMVGLGGRISAIPVNKIKEFVGF